MRRWISDRVRPIRARFEARVKREICLALDGVGLLKPINFVQWLVTYQCNFACAFCEASAGARAEDELSTSEALGLVDDLAQMKVKRLILSGGEPLVRSDIVEVMNHATRRGLRLGLVTNGFLVPELWTELQGLNLFLYFTSIDGPKDFHDSVRREGSFSRALLGLEQVASIGVPTRMVNTVVTPSSLALLPDLADQLVDSAATRWHLTPAAVVGRATADGQYALNRRQLKQLLAFIKANRGRIDVDLGESVSYLGHLAGECFDRSFFCGAGLTRCAVMPDGSVMGCHQVYDVRFAEGNIRQRPFSQIWRKEFRRFRHRRLPEYCGGCPHAGRCLGGCWAEMTLHGQCAKSTYEGDR